MASAKKGKKNKGKTLALIDFLQETPGAVSTMPIRKSTVNWADEVEDNHDVYDPRSSKTSVILPTAPKASRDFDDIIDKVPQDPPFIAFLTNLPYDVDENEISMFFKNMKIANMRIPKDDRPGEIPKLKGFGYVEFEDRESLLNALVIPDTTIKNRRIRIEVATDYDNDKRRSGRMDMSRDRSGRSDVSMGDWRSGPRQETSDMERRGFSRDRERDDSSSTWRDGDRRSNRDPDRGFNRDSDRNFNRDSDRSFNRDSDRGFTRSSDRFRDDRDQEFSRSRDEKTFMTRTRYDGDRGSRNGGFSRNPPPREDAEAKNEPRQRPKLVLTPRTRPVESEPEKVASSTAIFGNAKPVDTSARERQIEERLLAKDNDPPPRREPSRERKENLYEKENSAQREKKEKDKVTEVEKKNVEKEKTVSSPNPRSDVNGVIDKTHQQKKNGDHEKKEPVKVDSADKQKSDIRKREEKKEKIEKEMPKLKKAEPPNFIASNKFAYLQTEDNSD
ncbi:RRM 1 and/or eIF-4B domain containing protein [Asbolus verrucosus]|uniref:RRM 1 and/or eIF-4B domain containing protein n=1 Tax=Asbolus verrucosus TaxID=1661398 RepID=A0A482VEH3_ASBVE|nr:RRM 1 and/or eIF-4B domain containing protein [Asbolus verrucosus]